MGDDQHVEGEPCQCSKIAYENDEDETAPMMSPAQSPSDPATVHLPHLFSVQSGPKALDEGKVNWAKGATTSMAVQPPYRGVVGWSMRI